MKINILQLNGRYIAEVTSDILVINSVQDALDLMADCRYQGAGSIILEEKDLIPGFFDLKTGIAGEILQKFSNYGMRLAIVGDFSRYPGKSLRDFIFESNKFGRINFAGSREEALNKLSGK